MKAIEVNELSKCFKIKVLKKKGLLGNIKSMFSKSYCLSKAVDNISFSVDKGEKVAFIGPNGAGKSTTIKLLTGILHADSGKIKVLNVDPTKNRANLSYKIGTMFSNKEQLWAYLTVYDNFKFFGKIYNISDEAINKKIKEFKNIFGFENIIYKLVKDLSLGQRIACELLISFLHNPCIIFLDEPTIGLDILAKEKVYDIINYMNNKYNTTIFLTSHDLKDIEKICNRIIIINKGKIIQDGTINQLKFSQKKTIEIKFKSSASVHNSIKNISTYNVQNDSYIFETPQGNDSSFYKVFSEIDFNDVLDIHTQERSLETVIKTIYKEGKFNY